MSHTPPHWNVESSDPADAAQIERLVNGRASVAAGEAQREAGLVANYARFAPFIRPGWDRALLDRFARGEARALAAESSADSIESGGGYGGQEIRTWLAAAGSAGDPAFDVLGYEPIDFLVTGMGAVAARLPAVGGPPCPPRPGERPLRTNRRAGTA